MATTRYRPMRSALVLAYCCSRRVRGLPIAHSCLSLIQSANSYQYNQYNSTDNKYRVEPSRFCTDLVLTAVRAITPSRWLKGADRGRREDCCCRDAATSVRRRQPQRTHRSTSRTAVGTTGTFRVTAVQFPLYKTPAWGTSEPPSRARVGGHIAATTSHLGARRPIDRPAPSDLASVAANPRNQSWRASC